MRSTLLFCLLFAGEAASDGRLPAGDGRFWLGMSRPQVDSMVAARGLEVISDRSGFLACSSDDPDVEFEQYLFFPLSDGRSILWKTTLAYRMPYTRAQFDALEQKLRYRLGDPLEDVGRPRDEKPTGDFQSLTWGDGSTTIRLGARWGEAQESHADRMLLSWIDRRLQRAVDSRRRQERSAHSR